MVSIFLEPSGSCLQVTCEVPYLEAICSHEELTQVSQALAQASLRVLLQASWRNMTPVGHAV